MQNKLPIPGKVTFLGGGPMMGQTMAYDHFRLDTTISGVLLDDWLWEHDYRIELESLVFTSDADLNITGWRANFYHVGKRRPWVPMEPCYE